MRKFKDLDIWTLGKDLAVDVYKLTQDMPKEEIYGLTSQMRRATISIPSNIAEGCSRNSNKEFSRFLEISMGSAFELETQLIISQELRFLDIDKVAPIIDQLNKVQAKTNSFIKSVKNF